MPLRSLKVYESDNDAAARPPSLLANAKINASHVLATNASLDVHSNILSSQESADRTVYVITPTYVRGTQRPDVTRFSQTLMVAHNIHWIIVEDSDKKTAFISDVVSRMPFPVTHLFTKKSKEEAKVGTRGCSQRNAGLKWIKENNIQQGVLYFADDDNAYDIRLFDELRKSTKVGFVPTGNLAKTGLSSPVVKNGKVVGYLDVWPGGRKWPVEMASIAINIEFWNSRGAPLFQPKKRGFAETHFLEAMKLSNADMQPLANNCTQFLVWHTKTVGVKVSKVPTSNQTKYKDTNILKLAEYLIFS